MKRFILLLIAIAGTTQPYPAAAAENIAPIMDELHQLLDVYPPKITTPEQKTAIQAKYQHVKDVLDQAVSDKPDDIDMLYRRASLQSMGHNLDIRGAYEGAEKDYVSVLKRDPVYEPAILGLARMWVNSSPQKAPAAEGLFRGLQCLHQDIPFEEAQRGLFFAFYYQGRIEEAKRQAEFLVYQWPNVALYHNLDDTVGAVLKRAGKSWNKDAKPAMLACTSPKETTN